MSRDACLWRGSATLHCWVASDWLLHKDLQQCNCGKKAPLRPLSNAFELLLTITSFDKLISSNLGTLSMSRREKGRWFSTIILQLGFKTQPKLGFHAAFLASVWVRRWWRAWDAGCWNKISLKRHQKRIAWLDPSQLSRPWGQQLQLFRRLADCYQMTSTWNGTSRYLSECFYRCFLICCLSQWHVVWGTLTDLSNLI